MYRGYIGKAINEELLHTDVLFVSILRSMAKPPIKGKITKGKLKWRNIKRVCKSAPHEEWLEQRGVRITPIFTDSCLMIHKPNFK